MKHRDLGTIDGPVLLFGGPYSNLEATYALIGVAQASGIPGARMICTGDVVAYCGDPGGTADLIRNLGAPVVAGNCERQLASGAPDCGCGFEAGTVCDVLSAGWFGFAASHISQDQRDWMAAVPDVISFRQGGKRYGVIHGGVTDIARFIWVSTSEAVLTAEWDALEQAIGPVDAIIAGHSGIPFLRQTDRGSWINAGVIGMPPHDGAPHTRYAILSQGNVTFHALFYDVDGAVTAMKRAGLTQGYDRALRTGYWPSEDVLPPDLRRAALARG